MKGGGGGGYFEKKNWGVVLRKNRKRIKGKKRKVSRGVWEKILRI